MKKLYLIGLCLMGNLTSFAQMDSLQMVLDSVNASMHYQTGTVHLKGIATLKVPEGFKYLDAQQSNYVLSDLWGNPKDESSLGMLFPENMGPMDMDSWAFNITYDEMGYVKDDDADDIDYEELLTDMQNSTKEANVEREKMGYGTVELVGWAAKPYYDKDKHILHWAKELRFDESEDNTLNYNVRILGRKGVLVLNAIAYMPDLPAVNQSIDKVAGSVAFTQGNTYSEFNPGVDEIAAYSIGGLVAGKVLAKAGFFALLLKFWKVIAFGVMGAGTYVWRLIRGKSNEPAA